MRYSHIIFDLDGTLVDSASEIHEAAVTVSKAHGLRVPSLEYIRTMTGSPPRLFFLEHGSEEGLADQLVAEFRGHLADHAGNPACVFPDVVPLLEQLCQHAVRTSLATTKPTELAASLLGRYGLARFFSHIQGTDPPRLHKPHPDILHACMEQTDAVSTAMVGDTIFDVEAAHNAGIDSIAVSTGAHRPEKLASAKPTYLVESLHQLSTILGLTS
jgi:phosphoglycolate phosphatase-like HAD superfamily hydrolase